MQNTENTKIEQVLAEIRGLLRAPSASTPSTHDLLNVLHTVLCSIEMLEMDITKGQSEVFDRLNVSAKILETQLQSYIRANGVVKNSIISSIASVDSK